jgi:Tfp pilus assembly protein PilO
MGYHWIHGGHEGQVRLIQTQIVQEQADQDAQRTTAALLQELEGYQQALPQEVDTAWLVSKVTNLAQAHRVQLVRISQEAPKPLSSFTRLSAQFQFLATYHEIGALLADVEASAAFIRVDRLEIAPPVNVADARASISVTMSTLYAPPVVNQPGSGRLVGGP